MANYDLNNCTVGGRLGRDPESRTSSSGNVTATFSIANNQGDRHETLWLDCIAFGKTAEAILAYMKKGNYLMVSGSICANNYEKRDGTAHKGVKLLVDRAVFPPKTASPEQPGSSVTPNSSASDDIPF